VTGTWTLLTVGLLAAAAGLSAAEPARVTVVMTQVEDFTDFKARCSGGGRRMEALRAELASFLQRAAAPYVQPPASLEISVIDVDMAGEFEGWRGPRFCDARIMRDIYAPRLRLTFRLTDGQNRRVIRTGTRDLRDATYLTRAAVLDRDPLRYEKALLHEWLRTEFGTPPARSGR
jgi:hypothetical protein